MSNSKDGPVAGIDVGRNRLYPCVLYPGDSVVFPKGWCFGGQDKIQNTVEWLQQRGVKRVAIDGPPYPRNNVLRQVAANNCRRSLTRRVAEFCLDIRGCYTTPDHVPSDGAINDWMGVAFALFAHLSQELGMAIDLGNGKGALLETHPTYAFKSLLGIREENACGLSLYRVDPEGLLRPKGETVGREQRLWLLERELNRLDIPFRRELFEQIDRLDAALCAVIAFYHLHRPEELLPVGHEEEGSIYLFRNRGGRAPGFPTGVTQTDFPQHPTSPTARATSEKQVVSQRTAPSGRKQKKLKANAIIFRLGQNGPGGLTQQDTIDLVLAGQENGIWLPVHSAVMGDRFGENLDTVGGHLYLCTEGKLWVHLVVDQWVQNAPYPGDERNPWPIDEDQVILWWVHAQAGAIEACCIPSEGYETRQRGEWRPGLPQHCRTTLLWARVKELAG